MHFRFALIFIVSYLIFLALPYRSFAQDQEFGFQKVPIEVNGIPFTQFVAIVQDQEGFLWLSTGEELLKYDGYEVEVYKHSLEDSTSLSDNMVGKLYVDTQGDLWVGHNIGLSRYKKNCDCFVNYPLASPTKSAEIDSIFQKSFPGMTKTSVSAITQDQNKQLWVATLGGDLFSYDRKADTFLPFLNNPNQPNSMLFPFINVLLADQHNNLWIGAGSIYEKNKVGLIRFNLNTGETKRFVHNPADSNSLLDSRVTALLEDQQGRMLVGTFQSGLHYYHPETEDFTRLLFNPSQSHALHAPPGNEQIYYGDYPAVGILHQDRKGGLWVGTYGLGLYHFEAKTGKLTVYAYDQGQPTNFVNNNFNTFYEDRQEQLWLGTLQSGGLYKMDTYAKKFTWYPSLKRAQRSCESKTNPGVFWISSMGEGLRRLDKKTGLVTTYLHDEHNLNSIGHNQVRAVHEDDDGILWIGIGDGGAGGFESGNGGLDRMDTKTGIFQHYSFKRKDKSNFDCTVYAIYEDEEGRLWFDTGAGIFRSDRQKKNFELYVIPGSEGSDLWLFSSADKNTLWVTDFTKKIMYRFEPETDQFIPIIKGDFTQSVLEDESGYWIPTWNRGLLHFDPRTGITQRFTTADGLPSDEVRDILSTEVGTYWVATLKGITKFTALTKTFNNDGLPKGYFHPIWLKSKDGQLFFGADEGIVAFYPEEVEGNPVPPELAFTQLQISGEPFPLLKDEHGKLKEIHLNSRQNDFNIAYAGLHFSAPSRNKYQYKLSPFDQDWIDAGTQRSARYTNLEPGKYTFQVKAANSDGVWTEASLVLPFFIHQAWWKSGWFYTLSIFIIAGISYWFYRFQLSKTLAVQESERLQEINQLKTTLYNNITHEFRTPLTVILGMTENLKLETEKQQLENFVQPLKMIERNGQSLLHLVNEMLDLAKIDSGHLELTLQQADIIPFIKYLGESFHSLAAKKGIHLDIQAAEQTLIMDFDTDKLAIVVANLLSNAIKFTPEEGEVVVHLNTISLAGAAHFSLTIKDNGIGIAPEELPYIFDRFYQADHSAVRRYQGTGIGLALTKELVTLMKGTVQVESELGKGSKFIVQLPIHRKAPLAESPTNVSLSSHSKSASENYLLEELPQGDVELPLVLIIEDQIDVAHYISTCLQGKYQYLHAANGKLGIETAFEKIPDLIICDIMMPEKDGFEVCATLKQDERTNHIPVILLTARVTVQDRLTGLGQGADAYLAKPFEKEELWIRLHQLFELRKTLQKKYSEQLFIDTPNETIAAQEDPFIVRARTIVLAALENENFSLDELSEKLYLSRSQVHRKIKAVTGMSTAIFIRTIRLQEAKKLLASTDLTISEIAYQVGFKSPVYFSQMFKQTFGESPSDLRK